jgi:hypothetical protein
MSPRARNIAWRSAVAIFLGMALWPIWAARFPPMQDYPQYLLHAHMLEHQGDPAFDYDRYFDFHQRPLYAAVYLTTLFFSKVVAIEVAGKLSLSIYPLLVGLVVYRLGRRIGAKQAPWGALLFFPLAFNQQYYLGNLNFLLALPLLVLALLDLEDLMASPPGAWPWIRQFLWQAALLVAHPLGFFAYVGLAAVGAAMIRRRTGASARRPLVALGVALLLFAASWLGNTGEPPADLPFDPRFGWVSPWMTLEFFSFLFTGMQAWARADTWTLVLWGAVLATILASLVAARGDSGLSDRRAVYGVYLGLALLAMMVLPFRKGEYSYINVRVSAIAYFLIALLVAQIRFKGWLAACLVAVVGLCTLDSLAKQARISAAMEEVLPIVERIPPRSRILPLLFDRGSEELDRTWFDPHVNDYDYYHVLVGGGYNPYLIRSSIHPVDVKPGQQRPAPPGFDPGRFAWKTHGADYQYFLTRGAPKGVAEYLLPNCDLVATSGPWVLFERKR